MWLPWRFDLGQLIESTEELVESFNEFLSRKDQRQRREADDVCKQDAVKERRERNQKFGTLESNFGI